MVCYAKEQVAAARARTLETQIKRFAKGQQRRLRKLVKASSRLGDILYSFPAAAFAIVAGHGDHNRRGDAVRLIKDGADLRTVAGVLELPTWLRRLPPEAFEDVIDGLPTSEAFARKVVNCIPQDDTATAMWLRWVRVGNQVCHEDFALWLARQRFYRADSDFGTPVLPLATYAWFSGRDADDRARRMVPKPWHKQIGFPAAIENMCGWFDRVILDLTRGDKDRGPGRYRKRRRRHGYDLVALTLPSDLIEEGNAMNHCAGTYVSEVAAGNCVIYSVRQAGRRVATLELRWVYGHHRKPIVNQLLGHSNQPVGPEVKAAVAAWLREQEPASFGNPHVIGSLPIDETRWRALWASYIAAKGARAPVTERPSQQFVFRLSRNVNELTHGFRVR